MAAHGRSRACSPEGLASNTHEMRTAEQNTYAVGTYLPHEGIAPQLSLYARKHASVLVKPDTQDLRATHWVT